ncbi:MAG: GNAT family protein [Ferruginibacter sp.]
MLAHFDAGQHIILENDRARLEPLEKKHFEYLVPLAMEKELWKLTSVFIKDETDFKNYFDEAITEKENNNQWPYAVYDKLTGEYAGSTRFGSFAAPHSRMEIGWTWYNKNARGSGLNMASKHLLLTHAFTKLNLNRIELKTSLLNERSQKAMHKLGAEKEGILRRHMVNYDGTLRDSVYFSFIKEEWPETEKKYFSPYTDL